jgi:hypothetical protein
MTLATPLVRCYEKIGLGVRTQIEYFYQKVRPFFLYLHFYV